MSDDTSNIAIVILAAGASKRMGSPKQLLKWGNESLLTHAINKALNVKNSEVIVVLGANHGSIQKEIEQFPITILKNLPFSKLRSHSFIFSSNLFSLLPKNSKNHLIIAIMKIF